MVVVLAMACHEARQMATPIALASVVYLACRLVLPEARQMATPVEAMHHFNNEMNSTPFAVFAPMLAAGCELH